MLPAPMTPDPVLRVLPDYLLKPSDMSFSDDMLRQSGRMFKKKLNSILIVASSYLSEH